MGLNHIIVMGRLVRDPSLKKTAEGTSIINFTLAVDRDYSAQDGRKADFIDCVAFRNTADFVDRNFAKGQAAAVSGRLQIREWTGRDGNRRYSPEVMVDNVYFADSKRTRSEEGAYERPRNAVPEAPQPDFEELDDDGDLPF